MADFFMAIDQFEKKKRLLAGFSPNSRVSAYCSRTEEGSEEETDEEHIAAFDSDQKNKKRWWKKSEEKRETKEVVKEPVVKPTIVNEPSESEKKMIAMMNEMKGLLEYRRKPKVDRATVKCFRCQDMGHYAAECTAEKPVWRERKREETGN